MTEMLLLFAAYVVTEVQRVSPLAKALFNPLPGTKSDQATASLRSNMPVLYQKSWGKVADSSSFSSKIGEGVLLGTNVL